MGGKGSLVKLKRVYKCDNLTHCIAEIVQAMSACGAGGKFVMHFKNAKLPHANPSRVFVMYYQLSSSEYTSFLIIKLTVAAAMNVAMSDACVNI